MAPLMYFKFRKVLLLVSLVVFLFSSTLLLCAAEEDEKLPRIQSSSQFLASRKMLELDEEDEEVQPKKIKTKTTTSTPQSSKNQTKLIKPTSSSSKNQTKLLKPLKPNLSSKNQTKLIKPSTNPTKSSSSSPPSIKIGLKKLNSTSKPSNSTKPTSLSSKKTSDLAKLTSPKNKTTKPTTTKQPQTPKPIQKTQKTPTPQKPTKKPIQPSWIEQEDDTDFVSDFTDLPGQFQQSLIPDLEKISTTSKIYLTQANKQMTTRFKPLVGNKYAPTIASIVSCAFLLIPLLLVSLLFNRIKAYFSLQKLLIFIQVYLSIYFSILCLSSLVTGLEPLKFFYATSQSTYICLQVLQTLGYVLYLLLLIMYLILVFSTDSGLGSKMLGLAQTFLGFAVGLHYYMSVFHRAVLRQPPKTNWKVHGIYATCYLVICLFATAERRKKAYLEEGGEEGKKN
ncbi:hypothetical protein RchiOBHm_Chr2g0114541 [Rosa chinensis]|uniref:Uncharacterized protein n=1 Tax=Rosa chinensis TaxID=74649 RepID=A0A2P6RQR1_ROSCH|nr:uncharacterized protein LOC112187669 isoform X1 [Rosa chinensis]PRQ48776.1 hypothetical protein RchiOBHm_Chr2g0114541 [Rosa chinensis]